MDKLRPKIDCFAYSPTEGCTALNKLYCVMSDKCKFYKSKEEYKKMKGRKNNEV